MPSQLGPADGVSEHRLLVGEAEQRVQEAAVAHVHLRGAHQPLAGVRQVGRQAAHEQQVDHQVEVVGDRSSR